MSIVERDVDEIFFVIHNPNQLNKDIERTIPKLGKYNDG